VSIFLVRECLLGVKKLQRFNMVLLPKEKGAEFVLISQRFYSEGADYVLGEGSLPHVTIAQFEADGVSLNLFLEKIQPNLNNEMMLHFSQLDCRSDLDRPECVWLSLLPVEDKMLHFLHKKIFSILQECGITCISKSLDFYYPHLTLLHVPMANYKHNPQHPIYIDDVFYVAIGLSDEIGQFVGAIDFNSTE